jgi:hypothetical protein
MFNVQLNFSFMHIFIHEKLYLCDDDNKVHLARHATT